MLSHLWSRHCGIESPARFSQAEATRRVLSLAFNMDRKVEQVHADHINSLDIEPINGRYLLSGGSDGIIALYDLENSYKCRALHKIDDSHPNAHTSSVENVQWCPHNTGVFTSSSFDKTLKVWDTDSLQQVGIFQLDSFVYSHHMCPLATEHSLIAVGTKYQKVQICDLKSASSSHILRGHRGEVLSVRWSPRHDVILATASTDKSVKLWDIRKAARCLMTLSASNGETSSSGAAKISHNGAVNGLCFTSDGLYLLSLGKDRRMRLWNSDTGENMMVNYGNIINGNRQCVKFTVSAGCNLDFAFVPFKSSIAVYNIHTGIKVSVLGGHYKNVECCVFHPHYQDLYSGGQDSKIMTWVPAMREPLPKEDADMLQDAWSSSDEDA